MPTVRRSLPSIAKSMNHLQTIVDGAKDIQGILVYDKDGVMLGSAISSHISKETQQVLEEGLLASAFTAAGENLSRIDLGIPKTVSIDGSSILSFLSLPPLVVLVLSTPDLLNPLQGPLRTHLTDLLSPLQEKLLASQPLD